MCGPLLLLLFGLPALEIFVLIEVGARVGAAETLEGVGDVGRAAAELALERRGEERHVQHVEAIGEDVVLEVTGEHHDGVVGHRTADQYT
jgi:hypothetical protein